MTKDEALKLALSALDEVRQETFRLMRDGQTLYAEKKVWEAIYTIKKVLAQEQETVAKKHEPTIDLNKYAGTYGGYTTPPAQRTWVGLTKEEIAEFDTWHDHREEEVGWCNPSEIVAYIEAKLRSKNNV